MQPWWRACLIAGLLAACEEDPFSGSWGVGFECEALASAAAAVEVRLLEGGCGADARELYAARLSGDEPGAPPPELPAGSYGFGVEAFDADGASLARRCDTARLPAERQLLVLLRSDGLCPAPDGGRGDDGGVEGDSGAGDREANCEDNLRNGDETDRDCGGPECAPCNDFESCRENQDCKSLVCEATQCRTATCEDRVKSGTETDADCGGLFCPPCGEGEACQVPTDCENLGCDNGLCLGPACDDGLRNGDESDIDCGGACDPCGLQEGCAGADDCESGACDEDVCVVGYCLNGALDPGESDVDCGGDSCAPCLPGKQCAAPGDCTTGICVGELCQEFQPYAFEPANFDPRGLDPTAAPAMTLLDCGATVLDTDALAFTNWCHDEQVPRVEVRTQGGGPDLAVVALRSLTVASGSLLRMEGSRAAVLAVHGDATIDGDLDVAARGSAPGAGGNVECGSSRGEPGGFTLLYSETGGGGGGGHRTAGGQGGDADNTEGGPGGSPRGGQALEPLLAGCPGGYAGNCPAQSGGGGGGGVQLSVAGSLVVNGRVLAGGGAGETCIGNQTGGSGGGSGGGILLEAMGVRVFGELSVDGGRGGDGSIGGLGGAGGTLEQAPAEGESRLGLGGGGGGGGSSGYTRILEHGP